MADFFVNGVRVTAAENKKIEILYSDRDTNTSFQMVSYFGGYEIPLTVFRIIITCIVVRMTN